MVIFPKNCVTERGLNMELIVGSKYRLGRKIGSGSFGDIYLGECGRSGVRGINLRGI